MTSIQINGEKFTTDTDWVVDAVTVSFTDAPGNATTFGATVYNPSGPNAGTGNLADAVVNQWNDSTINIDFDGSAYDPYVTRVVFYNEDESETIFFDVNPDQSTVPPPPEATIIDVTSPADNTLEIEGTLLDQPRRYQVVGSSPVYNVYYYDSAGPEAGLNPVGATVTVTPDLVTIVDPVLDGEVIDVVRLLDYSNIVTDSWFGSVPIT